ncbi:MAG: thiolase family protein [Bacteroidota bacterium]
MESVILSAVRTPIGAFQGSLSALTSPKLGSIVISEAIKRAGIANEDVCEVIMGNVLAAGVGQAPARQAAIYAGLPESVYCMTINKVCGSGLKAVMLGDQSIRLGDSDFVVAGGMESMTNAPYILFNARNGYRMGHGEVTDSMIFDGLWDPYSNTHMGIAGELCATEYKITREEQDEFAINSYKRALDAMQSGGYKNEIIPVVIEDRKGTVTVEKDEEPEKIKFDKVPSLKPVFKKDGTITAANASSIDDGASALVIASADKAKEKGLKPLAKIIAYATHAQNPQWFTTAPAEAIKKVLKKTNMQIDDIDYFEINEAFATVPIVANRILNIPYDKMNVNGGAIALGHPIGASGARILTTLIYALKRDNKKLGLASLCIGGGEAVALIIEML